MALRSSGGALIGSGLVLYCGLALAFLAQLPFIEQAGKTLPHSVVALALTVVGPAVLFSGGIDAWPAVAAVVALIAAFLGLARVAWRRSPETEWFAVWIICAVLVWAVSGWLLVAAAA